MVGTKDKDTVGTLGELERSVMDAIWVHDDGLSAAELRDAFADRDLALTTIHTVLTRLEKKASSPATGASARTATWPCPRARTTSPNS